MDRGIYAATSNGMVQLRKLEVANNNLANINTAGFKKQVITGQTQTFDQTLASLTAGQDPYAAGDHQRTSGVVNINTSIDFSQGPIQATGRALDVALRNANDFFQIQTPDGVQYTRAGNFTLSGDQSLVTPDGMPVMGDGGVITVNGPSAEMQPDGTILVNGVGIGRVGVVRIEDTSQLEAAGGTRFKLRTGAPAPADVEADLVTGSLEGSNVSAISGMVDLITTQRAFQMYARTVENIDALNQAAINQVGRPRG